MSVSHGQSLTRKPRLADWFCCAGGAGKGYSRAGFEVVGSDIKPQPRYPFEFRRADVLTLDPEELAEEFDAIHASPPCQGYTALRHAPGTKGAPLLIDQVRDLLEAWAAARRRRGLSHRWIIENVEEARWALRDPVMLCGSMFGLGAQGCQLQRHRLFEANFPLRPPGCAHGALPVIGVYGGHARRRSAKAGGRGTKDVWEGGHKAAASEALGIDWMTLAELSESIPPAYTEWLGRELLSHMRLVEAA